MTDLEEAQIKHLKAEVEKIHLEKRLLKRHPLLRLANWATVIGGALALAAGWVKFSEKQQALSKSKEALESALRDKEIAELEQLKAEREASTAKVQAEKALEEYATVQRQLGDARNEVAGAEAAVKSAEDSARRALAEADKILEDKQNELKVLQDELAEVKKAINENKTQLAANKIDDANTRIIEQRKATEETREAIKQEVGGKKYRIHIFARNPEQAKKSEKLKAQLEESGFFVYNPKHSTGNAPSETQVRYFYYDEKAIADLILNSLQNSGVDKDSRLSYVLNDRYGNAKGHIEVWLKTTELD